MLEERLKMEEPRSEAKRWPRLKESWRVESQGAIEVSIGWKKG